MLAYRARYVFPVERPPLADAIVAIDHDRIVAVGDASSRVAAEFGAGARDLGNVAILPGLINAHTHLEFSDLHEPLGAPKMPFADWIRLVVRERRARPAASDSIDRGLAESAGFGVTAIGEIASMPWYRSTMPLEVTEFCEVIAFRTGKDDPRLAAALSAVGADSIGASDGSAWSDLLRPGISPHTPYTVRPEIIQELARLSAKQQIPLAMHLAETREELSLLREATGSLVDLLSEFDQWDASAIAPGSRPIDYLRWLREARRALIIHGNYLDDAEIAFLGQNADRMSVVYCPRTHAYFGHDPYPLSKLLAAGANVAIGTDSRASTPDLSPLAEFQFAAERHGDVAPATLLRMISLAAAKALGRERELGSIEAGKYADLAFVALPDHDADDPHELLVDRACKVAGSLFRGRS